MKEFWNFIQMVFMAVGGWLGWFMGGCDGLLYALIAFVVIDYLTGVMCAFADHTLSSEVVFRGICRKVLIFLLVGMANILDVAVIGNGSVLRTAVIFFYISNEGVSLLEGSVNRYGEDADFKSISEKLLKVNNLAIEGKPDDLVINTHVCRGNYHSAYFSSGAYDPVAEKLFGEENVNAYYLEFDDERSGGFEPLKYVSGDKKVVLGLITTKSPVLENKQTVINRIHEAAKYIPLDRLYLSPQCGFASCEIGNKLTEEEQWAKLALVKEIAEEVWK